MAPQVAPLPAMASPDEAARTIGLNLGQQLRQYGVTNELSVDKIVEGLKDGLAGEKPSQPDQQRLQAYLRSVIEGMTAKNEASAKEYLERNAKQKGVKTTASGLQYRIIDAGNAKAASPQPTDQVTVQYRGSLIDGTEFDSSKKHGAAATFTVSGVIKGWQEALELMKPGAKWQLAIPPELAYGRGPRPGIPGGSLLIFDLGLPGVTTPTPPPPAAAASNPAPASATPAKPH